MNAAELVHELMTLEPHEEVGIGLFENGDVILRSLDSEQVLALWPVADSELTTMADPRPGAR